MYINATIIVQAVHFFIAYLLLKHFFLRPAFAIIDTEQAEKAVLQATVDSRLVVVQQKEGAQREHWRSAQRALVAMVPPISKLPVVVKGGIAATALEPIPHKVINDRASAAAQAIVAEISHVR